MMSDTIDSDDSSASKQSAKRLRGRMPVNSGVTLESLEALILKLNTKIETISNEVSNNIKTSEQNILSKVNDLIDNVNTNIDKVSVTCSERHNENLSKINELSGTVCALQNQLIDECERNNRLSDIIVYGIPIQDNETGQKLDEIWKSLAHVLNFDLTKFSVNKVYRLKSKTNNISNILIKFSSIDGKKDFMNRYFNFKQLNVSHIGIAGTQRIYCNENLTILNHKLFTKAMALKGTHLHSVYSFDGLIYIRINPRSRSIRLLHEQQLSCIQPLKTLEIQKSNNSVKSSSSTSTTNDVSSANQLNVNSDGRSNSNNQSAGSPMNTGEIQPNGTTFNIITSNINTRANANKNNNQSNNRNKKGG